MEIVTDDSMPEKVKSFINRINEKIDTPEELAYKHMVRADALRMKNFFWEAIDEYQTSLKYDKTNTETYRGLGLAYKQTGYTQNAVNAFAKAKKLAPFDKTLYYEIGCCLCMDKKYDKAIKEYKKALKISPDFIEAKLNLSLTYELNNQHKLALENYKKIIETDPENVSAYNALGSLFIKLEMFNSAIKTFRQILKIQKDYSRAYLGIAIASDKMNNNSDALRYYKKYVKLKPNCGNLPFIMDRITELRNEMPQRKTYHLKLVS